MFLGQETRPEPKPVDSSPQKSFSIIIDGGEPEFISADYVNFTPGHVSFWLRTPDAAKQDILVACIRNEWLDEMKEVDY